MKPEGESRTRSRRIDPILDALGWRRSEEPIQGPHRIEEYETNNGPADYALYQDDRVLGIVEAKRFSLRPRNALTQAERYACGAAQNPFDFPGLHIPFLYCTNGEVIWFHNIRHLIENLSIGREGFDEIPVFARYGAWTKANRDFEGDLVQFLREVNKAIAA